MSLPTNPDGTPKPLEVNFNGKRMTSKEAKMLKGGKFSFDDMIEFLVKYSNWTRKEIDGVTDGPSRGANEIDAVYA